MASTIFDYSPVITVELIAMLQEEVDSFVAIFASTDSDHRFSEVVQNITKIVHGTPVSGETLKHITDALGIIRKISAIESSIWESDGVEQFKTASSLSSLLLKTLNGNFHTVREQCQVYDAKTHRCKLGNPLIVEQDGRKTDEHVFSCEFHMYDSLSIHLTLASLTNMIWAINNSLTDHQVMMAGLLGLYHDIGKMQTVEIYEFKNTMITGFPAHAEAGAMLFQMHHNNDMDQYISKTDYMVVSIAILRHMCGYHGDANESNSYKRDLLLIEQPEIRRLLTINRVGDYFGKIPDAKLDLETPQHFLEQQKFFEQKMSDSNKFDLDRLFSYKNHCGSIESDKIIIYLIGTSGAGKTYFVEKARGVFKNNVTVVSRDELIAAACVSVHKRLEGEAYVNMYKIYEAGKALAFYLRKISSGKKLDKREQQEFEKNKVLLTDVQTKWNTYIESVPECNFPHIDVYDGREDVPNIPEKVQQMYEHEIYAALGDKKRFLILDTFMNCFPMAVESTVPKDLNRYFRVHIHIQSYLERKTSTITQTIEQQLKVSGPYGLENLVHPDGFKNGKTKKMFASLSSEIGTDGPFPRSMFASRFRPHLVAGVITRTEQNPDGIGYSEVFNCLSRLVGKNTVQDEEVSETVDEKPPVLEKTAGVSIDVFGVDPVTKNMDVVTFYNHLYKRYSGDINRLQEYLRCLDGIGVPCGFMHISILEKKYEMMPSAEQKEFCTALGLLSTTWAALGVVKTECSAEEFEKNKDLRDRYSNTIVILKYYEQFGARFWQNNWAKEMRGLAGFVHPESGEFEVLSYKLPRGAEVVTGMVANKGIDTQDVKEGRIDILDDEQKDTCTRLCKKQPINMHLTSKGDGSLCVVNSYTGRTLDIMIPIVEVFGSDYSKLWARMSLDITGGKRMLIPATQGTVMEGGFMAPYMVTSMLVGSGIVTREKLVELHDEKKTYIEVWQMYGEEWIKKFLQFRFFDDLSDTQTFCFEAICKNRCGLFGDRPHTELACTYDRDRFIFLGTSIAKRRFYIPHTVYETNISKNIPFEVPLWWNIADGATVDQMIDDIDLLMRCKMTKEEYLKTYPPSNNGFDVENSDHIRDAILDFEGWVAMKIACLPVTDPDHAKVIDSLKIPLTIYSKIKTHAYYISHKFHEVNVPTLIELGRVCNVFPLATKLASICESGVITRRLAQVREKVLELLDFNNPDNKILPMLREIYAKMNKEEDANGIKKKSKDPFADFDKRPFDVQCKIALNFRGFKFGSLLLPIYLEAFPELEVNYPDLENVLASITMNFQPWASDYNDRIKDLDPFNPSIRTLITACLGSEFF